MAESQQEPKQPDEPKGDKAPRSYRVLCYHEPQGTSGSWELWRNHGLHPGANPQAAIKRARSHSPELRKALADGAAVVAVPESYFEPMTLTIEVVEREAFKKVNR